MGYLTVPAKTDLSGYLDSTDHNIVEKGLVESVDGSG